MQEIPGNEIKISIKKKIDSALEKSGLMAVKLIENYGFKDVEMKDLVFSKMDHKELKEKLNPVVILSQEIDSLTVHRFSNSKHIVYGTLPVVFVIDFDYFRIVYYPI